MKFIHFVHPLDRLLVTCDSILGHAASSQRRKITTSSLHCRRDCALSQNQVEYDSNDELHGM